MQAARGFTAGNQTAANATKGLRDVFAADVANAPHHAAKVPFPKRPPWLVCIQPRPTSPVRVLELREIGGAAVAFDLSGQHYLTSGVAAVA